MCNCNLRIWKHQFFRILVCTFWDIGFYFVLFLSVKYLKNRGFLDIEIASKKLIDSNWQNDRNRNRNIINCLIVARCDVKMTENTRFSMIPSICDRFRRKTNVPGECDWSERGTKIDIESIYTHKNTHPQKQYRFSILSIWLLVYLIYF